MAESGLVVAARRRPPAPGGTVRSAPMARVRRFHRSDLPTWARFELRAEPAARRRPDAGVWKLLVELCEPKKARLLARQLDRKSTRLNSSHSQISYAVFCLKKKKKTSRLL